MTEDTRAPSTNIYVQPATVQPGNGMAIASLVLGILALATVWIPFFGMVAWLFSTLGLIFGFVGLSKPYGRGMAIAGTVCSAVGLLACIGWVMLFVFAAAAGASMAP